jgi:predicted HAD superfamily Cof-like phosphohydrolase
MANSNWHPPEVTAGAAQCDMVSDLRAFHDKMKHSGIVQAMTEQTRQEFLRFRINFLDEEVNELEDAATADDAVDALIDLIYVAVGTLDLFGVDIAKAWNEVHTKNMQKYPGANATRPNRSGFPDAIKPDDWESPCHKGNTGLL